MNARIITTGTKSDSEATPMSFGPGNEPFATPMMA